jgi:hypothetical protein
LPAAINKEKRNGISYIPKVVLEGSMWKRTGIVVLVLYIRYCSDRFKVFKWLGGKRLKRHTKINEMKMKTCR